MQDQNTGKIRENVGKDSLFPRATENMEKLAFGI